MSELSKEKSTKDGYIMFAAGSFGVLFGLIAGWLVFIYRSDATFDFTLDLNFFNSLWDSTKALVEWGLYLLVGSVSGITTSLIASKIILSRRDKKHSIRLEAEKAQKKPDLTARSLSVMLSGDRAPHLDPKLQAAILSCLDSAKKIRAFMTPPDGDASYWMEPTFKESCNDMTKEAIESISQLNHKWSMWHQKEIPSQKTHKALGTDISQLHDLNLELQSVLSISEDIVISQSPDWNHAQQSVSSCRKFAELLKETGVIKT